jgi:hypothetical protein
MTRISVLHSKIELVQLTETAAIGAAALAAQDAKTPLKLDYPSFFTAFYTSA